MYNYSVVDFREWFEEQFINWSKLHGNKSENQFSAWLGISQSTVNAWRLGTRGAPRTNPIIEKLAAKLSPEIYNVLGLRRPDTVDLPFDALPPAMRDALFAATHELADTLASYKINPASPEGEALTISVMGKHGFRWIDTNKPEQPG